MNTNIRMHEYIRMVHLHMQSQRIHIYIYVSYICNNADIYLS